MLHCCCLCFIVVFPGIQHWGASRWIKQKFLLPPSGQSLRPVSNCNIFLDFPSFHSFYLLQSTFQVDTRTSRVAFVRSRFCFASILLVPELGVNLWWRRIPLMLGLGLCCLNDQLQIRSFYDVTSFYPAWPLQRGIRSRSMWFRPTFQVLGVSLMHEWLWQLHFLHLLTVLMLDRFMDFPRAAMFTSLGKRVPEFAGLEERSWILAHHIFSPAYSTDFMQGHLKVAEITTFSPRDHGAGVGPRKAVFASSLPVCCLSNFLPPHSVTLWVITAWITDPG